MQIKRGSLDILFSRFIRLRAANTCQRCGKYKDFKELQTAHCWGRRKKSVRWDEDNALALCFYCHKIIDGEDPDAKKELFTKYLGEVGYKKLGQRANWPNLKKPDERIIEYHIKEELKKYK
jgi:hypothetical protein